MNKRFELEIRERWTNRRFRATLNAAGFSAAEDEAKRFISSYLEQTHEEFVRTKFSPTEKAFVKAGANLSEEKVMEFLNSLDFELIIDNSREVPCYTNTGEIVELTTVAICKDQSFSLAK